jgi:hypothetical protein
MAASFRVSLTALRRRDRLSRFGSSRQSLWGASQRRERNVDHWLEHGRASMLRRGGRGSRERSPCVSTGRSIHAVTTITPSPGEGIQDLPSRPQAGSGAGPVRWPRPRSPHCRAGSPYPDDDVACGRAVCGPLCGSYGRSPERNERGTCGSEPPPVTRRRDRQDD